MLSGKVRFKFDNSPSLLVPAPQTGGPTENLSWEEACNPSSKEEVIGEFSMDSLIFFRMWQEFRDKYYAFTGKTLPVSSLYRTPTFNATIPDALPDSCHIYGTAADCSTGAMTDGQWSTFVGWWRSICSEWHTVGEIIRYPDRIHIGAFIEHTKTHWTDEFKAYDYR